MVELKTGQKLAFQIRSTGSTLFEEYTELDMVHWHKKVERQLLRLKTTPEKIKEAILNNDMIVGWVNYEQCPMLCSFVFKGYDKFFEKRIEGNV